MATHRDTCLRTAAYLRAHPEVNTTPRVIVFLENLAQCNEMQIALALTYWRGEVQEMPAVYYTPIELVNPAAGSAMFLSRSVARLVNPPYQANG